jgi:hypothetical protein
VQASPQFAEDAFAFLRALEFSLRNRWVTGGDSFKDGWQVSFTSPNIELTVQYLDAQFEIYFERAGLRVSYLEIDRELFDRRSGFHGDMFPPQKLEGAILRIAADIDANYRGILAGAEHEWSKLASLKVRPREARRLP